MKIIETDGQLVLELYPIETEEQMERVGSILVEELGAEVLTKNAGPGYQSWTLRMQAHEFNLEHSSILGNRIKAMTKDGLSILVAIKEHFDKLLAANSQGVSAATG